jgi:uncharacterized damage-inducible protein DinB
MISPSYVRAMARYNAWQNVNVYQAAGRLTDAARREERGAFFGSIHATLNHILWADQTWLMRFGAAPPPAARSIREGLSQFPDWEALVQERRRFDRVIEDWASRLQPSSLEGNMTWRSASAGRDVTSPMAVLVMHLFNHQTHHRGQVHALLTSMGVDPGITDLPFGPDRL